MTQYVCPRCQIRQLRKLAPLSLRSRMPPSPLWSIAAGQHARAGRTRSLHTKHSARSAVAATLAHDDPEPPLNSLSENEPAIQVEDIVKGTPSIRDHLRAWQTQQTQQKIAELDGSVPRRGRIKMLPNSLFMNETEPDYDSIADETELADFDAAVEGMSKSNLEPGDACVFKPPMARKQLAVFLGQAGTQLQYLLQSGAYCQTIPSRQNMLGIQGFASEEEIATIVEALPKQHIIRDSESELPSLGQYLGEPPESVRGLCSILSTRLQRLDSEVLEFRRSHTELLDTLYERLAEENKFVRLPFNTFVNKLLGPDASDLSDAGRMAIYMMADRDPTKLLLWHVGRNSHLEVLLGPRTLVRQFAQVVEWAREYQECAAAASKDDDVRHVLQENPVKLFIDKARGIIKASRKLRSPTTIGCLGPSNQQNTTSGEVTARASGEEFSAADRSILEFIYDTYIREPASKYTTRHHSIASLILRGIGAYPKMTLEDKIGRLLLQELGAMAPWAETNDDHVLFPVPGRKGAHEVTELSAEAEKVAAELGFKLGTKKLPLPDSMQHIRKDLGQMPAFVIDSHGTDVADDAISIEESADRPGCYWLHVHVAHPSAFITPDSIFGRLARAQGSTWYNTNITYPMLPAAVGEALSLVPGSPALTTSTLLDEKGNVLDVRVEPTRVHNLIYLQPEGVDPLLGFPKEDPAVLIVGPDPAVKVKEDPVKTKQAIDKARPYVPLFEKAMELLKARQNVRNFEQVETLNFPIQQRFGECSVNYLEPYKISRLHESSHYIGDPTIRIQAPKRAPHGRWADFTQKKGLVEQSMILACESTGKWLGDRQIPAIFAGSQTDPSFPISKLNAASFEDLIITPRGVDSADPVRHITLSVEQYVRATSPLRRFGDLLAQWNADAYMRAEADGLMQPKSPLPKEFELPYSRATIEKYIRDDSWVNTGSRSQDVKRFVHWSFQALFRAFHFKEAELPEIWDAQVNVTRMSTGLAHPDLSQLQGTLYPFTHRCAFLRTKEGWENQARRGQYLPVKLDMVDATLGLVLVKAVGPPSDSWTQVDDREGGMVFTSKRRRLALEREEREKKRAARAAKLTPSFVDKLS